MQKERFEVEIFFYLEHHILTDGLVKKDIHADLSRCMQSDTCQIFANPLYYTSTQVMKI